MAWMDIATRPPASPLDWSVRRQPTLARWLGKVLMPLAVVTMALLGSISPALAADQPAADGSRLQAGAALFEAHCMGCHVNGGNIIRRGRTLKLAALERAGLDDPKAIARIASGGIGQMSGYGTVLGEEGAAQVAEWVWLQTRAGWPQPARMEPLP